MRVLITGYSGSVARGIIDELNTKYDLVGVGRRIIPVDGIETYALDITKKEELLNSNMLNKYELDVIIHFAACLDYNDDAELFMINCLGTQNIVDLAVKTNCKIVIYISSIPIAENSNNLALTEDSEVNLKNNYYLTKFLGEVIIENIEKKGINYKILRIASPVGKYMKKNKIFSVFCNNSFNGNEINISGNGNRVQNYIDTRDLAFAIDRSINYGRNGLYLINGNSISDINLAKSCLKVCNSKSTINILNPNMNKKEEKWFIDGTKAKIELGYEPKFSIEDSIKYVLKGLK